jgi:hypothetical protein
MRYSMATIPKIRKVKFRSIPGTMYTSNGDVVYCKCGKPAASAFIGKEAFMVKCSECSPYKDPVAEFVYRSPDLGNPKFKKALETLEDKKD